VRASIGCVVLTGGGREDELRDALGSLLAQRDVDVDVVLVGNGWAPTEVPDGVRAVTLAENRGIPAGRNAGVEHVRGDLLMFLDDDAALRDEDTLAAVAREFSDDPQLGALQMRVDSRDGGRRLRNWTPRLRVGDPSRSSDVAALWEGAVVFRRSVFDAVGGWPGEFHAVHEGVDLAWRVLDAGYRVHYAGQIVALHPSHSLGRNESYSYYGARNRVWLARRLPLPLGAVFVATFLLRSLPTLVRHGHLRTALRGYRDGLRGPRGAVRKLRARTLWTMTRNGRPPVI
jgi:GT2 family glycosyltransferase